MSTQNPQRKNRGAAAPAPPLSDTQPTNAFRAFLSLALQVHEQQLQLTGGADSGNPNDCPYRGNWREVFPQREAEVNRLYAAALNEADRTGFAIVDVERRLRALKNETIAVLLWPRDAPELTEQERQLRLASGGWSGGPVGDYLRDHGRRMYAAWMDVESLALRIEAPAATTAGDGGTAPAQSPPAVPEPPGVPRGTAPQVPVVEPATQTTQLTGAEMTADQAACEPEGPNKTDNGLVFLPGGFRYRGIEESLPGKPLDVLKAFYDAPDKTMTLAALLAEFWSESDAGPEVVRNAISDARKALRRAMERAKQVGPADPIPCVNKGERRKGERRTAWKLLDLP
jgi:hypothetical protein